MKKFCCVAALAVVVSGCVSAPTKSLDSGSTFQGKHVVVTQYAKPDFSAMTPGKAAFGLFGAMAMISAGNELVKSENIEDPAIEISDHLASDMAVKRSATILPASHQIAVDDNPSSLVKIYPGADVILDVKTINWMYNYYPTNWGKYHVMYTARVRLIDGKTGALVAQHMCKVDPTDPNDPPSNDALRADHAALLKQFLHKAANTCISDVEQQALRV
ncbi:hypothetical protein ACXU4B_17700 [Dyella soli]|uniref:Uncharacterized protein n=1 Tax=Dyella soli TaxID=522319 RepID=A0A4R0YJJ7_9GAMM|nr:hypothetical protein [Dyella soli]TCI06369.1 hypothetical protein EZM97_33320 [Dyella soli]